MARLNLSRPALDLVRSLGTILVESIESIRYAAEIAPGLTDAERADALGRSLAWAVVKESRHLPVATVAARLRATADALEADQARQEAERTALLAPVAPAPAAPSADSSPPAPLVLPAASKEREASASPKQLSADAGPGSAAHRATVRFAVLAARSAVHLLPDGTREATEAELEQLDAWARGATNVDVQAVWGRLTDGLRLVVTGAASYAALAAKCAGAAAGTSFFRPTAAADEAEDAASYAASAVAYEVRFGGDTSVYVAAREAHLEELNRSRSNPPAPPASGVVLAGRAA